MSPSFKRLLGPLVLTVCYWPLALIFLGLSLLGDCFAEKAMCEAGRRSVLTTVLTVELGIYAFLLFSIARRRSQSYWLIVTVCLSLFVLGWLTIGLGIR